MSCFINLYVHFLFSRLPRYCKLGCPSKERNKMASQRWFSKRSVSLLSFALFMLTFLNLSTATALSTAPAEKVFQEHFDNDGRRDRAVYNGSGYWTISTDKGMLTVQWGKHGDIPLPADYDCDGVTEIAVWRPSDGKWYISLENRSWSTGVGQKVVQWGSKGDIPVPANYDGDCEIEVAVWRPSEGVCFISLKNRSWDENVGRYSDQSRFCGR